VEEEKHFFFGLGACEVVCWSEHGDGAALADAG